MYRLIVPLLLFLFSVSGVGAAGASTPELIDSALARGEITAEQRLTYLGFALFQPQLLPQRYAGTKGWSGTPYVRELQAQGARGRFAQQLVQICDRANGASTTQSTNFLFTYDAVGAGLTIQDYVDALEASYTTEITSFGWPKPPFTVANTSGRYPVVVTNLSGTLYGYVVAQGSTYAGFIGDNPATTAIETDAAASCMVVNSDLSFAATSPADRRSALRVTMAHEYFHSIQMGVTNIQQSMWAESTAAYVESEFEPNSNDNMQYLPPRFQECLTNYPSGQNAEYSNWPFFAFASNRNGGIATPGGGENIVNAWLTNAAAGQHPAVAYANALTTKGTTLPDTFHAYANAIRFPKKCPAGSPYCFSGGDRIASHIGTIANDGALADVGATYTGSIKDSYAINWVTLPTSGSYAVTLRNTGSGGQLRASIVADMGSSLQVTAFAAIVEPGGSQTLNYAVPARATSVALTITNQAMNANLATCASHPYSATLGQATTPTTPVATPTATPTPIATVNPIPTAIPGGARVLAPLVPRNATIGAIPGTFRSSIVVANPGTSDTNVRIVFVTEAGSAASATADTFTVRAGASATRFVPSLAGLGDGRYAALIDADRPVTAIVNLASDGPSTSASYVGVGSSDAATTFYIPSVYRSYFGFSSSIVVQNGGASDATLTVTYKKPGSADVVEMRAISAGAAYTFDQASAAGLADGFIGSAVVTSSQPIAAIFNVSASGQLSSSNGFKEGAATVALPVAYNSYFDYNTSVLVQNVDSQAATVTITYFDSSTGSAAGTQSATVQPGASQLFLQFESGGRAAPVPSRFNGSAVVTSAEGRQLVAVVNVQQAKQGYLAAYNGFSASKATMRSSCPAILKGFFGYSTSLTVQNAGEAATSLTLTYVDGGGRTVDTVQVPTLRPGATYFSYTPALTNLPEGFNGAVVVESAGAKVVAVVNELLGTGAAGDQLFTYNCFSG